MYKKALTLIVLFSCFFISCRAKRQEITTKTTTQDSIVREHKVTYKDTTFYAPKAETSLKIPISELLFKQDLNNNSKEKNFTKKNAQAKLDVRIVDDDLQITATCDSLALRAKIKSELEKEFIKQSNNQSSSEKITKPPNILNCIVYFLLGFGICFLLKTFKIV